MTTRVERFLAHLDGLSGGVEPQFWPVESTWPGHHGLTAIGYRDMPDPGLLLGFTYGLSLARQDDWRLGRPELSISVRSDDPAWVLSIAYLAEQLRHDCPFSYGDTINFGEPIAQGSGLDGFVVFGPLAFDPDDARVDVGDDLPVVVAGMYPTYAVERQFIAERGLEAFWALDWDPYDVTRAPAL
ncbi:suppressor of fused domain protein [Kribbella sp. NPDC050281]|uniref:suppressor of fused domain protein n=1 Tax=Kribbella sp. NPDC050281 TaxID=3155515 RepID=UPI0033F4D385